MSENDNKSRFYLSIPAFAADHTADTQLLLDHLATNLDIACVTLCLDKSNATSDFEGDPQLMQMIIALQKKDIAVLADMSSSHYGENRKSFEKALETIVKMNFDGIHMSADNVLYARAREVLGQNAVIGVDCGLSKHHAMQLGETGADYVAFRATALNHEEPEATEQLIELVSWWQELFEVPCVALDMASQSQIEALLHLPSDFIALGPTHWPELSSNKHLLSWLSDKCPALSKVS